MPVERTPLGGYYGHPLTTRVEDRPLNHDTRTTSGVVPPPADGDIRGSDGADGHPFRLAEAVSALRGRGLRLTRLKRGVLEAFGGGDCALTAEDIGARVGVGGDLSPLYRCLASLEDAGILTHFYGADGARRYDPADEFGGHHHHLVCLNCAGVARVDGCALGHEIAAEASALGYVVSEHEVVLKGICPECRGAEPGAPRA